MYEFYNKTKPADVGPGSAPQGTCGRGLSSSPNGGLMTIFHKQEPWWYPQAKGLASGESVRINDSIKLSFNGRSYFLWDFREKEGENYEPMMTLAEKVAHMQMVNAKNDEARKAVTLPMPAMKHPGDWPSAAAVWLYQAGLNNFSIAQMGCYWNPDLERVVVPFQRYSGEASWVARRTHGNGTGPKYLMWPVLLVLRWSIMAARVVGTTLDGSTPTRSA